jgi:hypothetical protein
VSHEGSCSTRLRPNQTILQYGDGANIMSLGKTYLSSSEVVFVPINSGASKGSALFVLQSVSGHLTITGTNPLDSDRNLLVNSNGYNGCSSCGITP